MLAAFYKLFFKKQKIRPEMTSADAEDLDRKKGHGRYEPGAGEAARRGSQANTGLMMCTEESELCLMLVGKSSAGKSKTGNTILGEKKFDSSASSTSDNKTCKMGTVEWKGRKIVVVDTPSTFDTELTPEQVKQEVRSCISFSPLGPHCIVLVVRIGRYTEEEKKTIERIQDAFGDQAVRYMMIVFTRKDDLEDVSIHDYIKNSQSGDLQGLIQKCGNRYCAFNNRASPEEREEQVNELLTMIESMVKENSRTRYTIEMYEKAEKIHLEKLKKRKTQKRNPLEIEKEKLSQQFEEECKKIQEEAKIRQEKMNCYEKEYTIEDYTSRYRQDKEVQYLQQDSGPDSRGRRRTSGDINTDRLLHFEHKVAGVQQEQDEHVRALVSRMDVAGACQPAMSARHQSHVDTLCPLCGHPQRLDRVLDLLAQQQRSISELRSEVRELVKELHHRNNIDETMQVEQATT